MLALRKAAGLTQIELAKFLKVPQANIAFWEWSDKPPRSDLFPAMAKASASASKISSSAAPARPSPIAQAPSVKCSARSRKSENSHVNRQRKVVESSSPSSTSSNVKLAEQAKARVVAGPHPCTRVRRQDSLRKRMMSFTAITSDHSDKIGPNPVGMLR